MKNKILFLDFDGVLNNHSYLSQNMSLTPYNTELDPSKIKLLNSWLAKKNIDIVICSSWITSLSLDQIKELFKEYENIKIVETISPDYAKSVALKEYILKNKVSNFVIIDDDALFSIKDPINKHQVKTSFYTGLTKNHLQEALKVLKKTFKH